MIDYYTNLFERRVPFHVQRRNAVSGFTCYCDHCKASPLEAFWAYQYAEEVGTPGYGYLSATAIICDNCHFFRGDWLREAANE